MQHHAEPNTLAAAIDRIKEFESEKILGVAVQGKIKLEDGTFKEFYYNRQSPASHDDLRNHFYHEEGLFLPIPSALGAVEWEERGITVTYGFYSEAEKFLNRRQAARIAYSCGQTLAFTNLLTSVDLNDKIAYDTERLRKPTGGTHKLTSLNKPKGKRWAKPGRLK